MATWTAPNRTADLSTNARDAVTALVGFLCLADAPNVTAAQRTEFAAAASRQAHTVRGQAPGPLLFIVDSQQGRCYERLKRAFAEDGEVEIVVDRRRNERRCTGAAWPIERRQRDRRQQSISHELMRLGVAVVPRTGAVSAPADAQSRSAMPGQCRVLIIDDDPAIVRVLSSYFEINKERYVVETALSGERGLAALMAHRPDLVLLDITMPGMSGLEVLKRIRSLDTGIPVIMVTAAAHRETSEALRNGAFAYIPKPFDFRYFGHLIKLATEQGPSSRQRR
jgi:CheY-like chemotaxis protein